MASAGDGVELQEMTSTVDNLKKEVRAVLDPIRPTLGHQMGTSVGTLESLLSTGPKTAGDEDVKVWSSDVIKRIVQLADKSVEIQVGKILEQDSSVSVEDKAAARRNIETVTASLRGLQERLTLQDGDSAQIAKFQAHVAKILADKVVKLQREIATSGETGAQANTLEQKQQAIREMESEIEIIKELDGKFPKDVEGSEDIAEALANATGYYVEAVRAVYGEDDRDQLIPRAHVEHAKACVRNAIAKVKKDGVNKDVAGGAIIDDALRAVTEAQAAIAAGAPADADESVIRHMRGFQDGILKAAKALSDSLQQTQEAGAAAGGAAGFQVDVDLMRRVDEARISAGQQFDVFTKRLPDLKGKGRATDPDSHGVAHEDEVESFKIDLKNVDDEVRTKLGELLNLVDPRVAATRGVKQATESTFIEGLLEERDIKDAVGHLQEALRELLAFVDRGGDAKVEGIDDIRTLVPLSGPLLHGIINDGLDIKIVKILAGLKGEPFDDVDAEVEQAQGILALLKARLNGAQSRQAELDVPSGASAAAGEERIGREVELVALRRQIEQLQEEQRAAERAVAAAAAKSASATPAPAQRGTGVVASTEASVARVSGVGSGAGVGGAGEGGEGSGVGGSGGDDDSGGGSATDQTGTALGGDELEELRALMAVSKTTDASPHDTEHPAGTAYWNARKRNEAADRLKDLLMTTTGVGENAAEAAFRAIETEVIATCVAAMAPGRGEQELDAAISKEQSTPLMDRLASLVTISDDAERERVAALLQGPEVAAQLSKLRQALRAELEALRKMGIGGPNPMDVDYVTRRTGAIYAELEGEKGPEITVSFLGEGGESELLKLAQLRHAMRKGDVEDTYWPLLRLMGISSEIKVTPKKNGNGEIVGATVTMERGKFRYSDPVAAERMALLVIAQLGSAANVTLSGGTQEERRAIIEVLIEHGYGRENITIADSATNIFEVGSGDKKELEAMIEVRSEARPAKTQELKDNLDEIMAGSDSVVAKLKAMKEAFDDAVAKEAREAKGQTKVKKKAMEWMSPEEGWTPFSEEGRRMVIESERRKLLDMLEKFGSGSDVSSAMLQPQAYRVVMMAFAAGFGINELERLMVKQPSAKAKILRDALVQATNRIVLSIRPEERDLTANPLTVEEKRWFNRMLDVNTALRPGKISRAVSSIQRRFGSRQQ